MKTYTFNLESKLGTIDSITLSGPNRRSAKQFAKFLLYKRFKHNFPSGNIKTTYIV